MSGLFGGDGNRDCRESGKMPGLWEWFARGVLGEVEEDQQEERG